MAKMVGAELKLPCPISHQSPMEFSKCADLQLRKEALEVVSCNGKECPHYFAHEEPDHAALCEILEKEEIARRDLRELPRQWNRSQLPPKPSPAELPSASEPPVDLAPGAHLLTEVKQLRSVMERIEFCLSQILEQQKKTYFELRRISIKY